jgi:TRAP-type C4-dicarboxylate transport system substrate-binding protein
MNTLGKRVLIVAAFAAGLVGCGDDGDSTKAGRASQPVTLRIGTDDEPGRPAADQIEEFARQVEERSDGQVHVEPVWHAGGEDPQPDWDQVVGRMVANRELDMGMIPARAWDTEGVTSLRALHAPFLVTSNALVERIVTDEVATEMLTGLDTIGITGLALLPEGLRHVFSFDDPMLSAPAFEGATIRAPHSDTTYALFKALGATVEDQFDDEVTAAESSFALAGSMPDPGIATGNVTLFPKINSLVINTEVLDGLSDEQQEILHDAAGATRDWALANTPDDVELAGVYCANGGRVVVATEADLASLQQAAEPVYEELARDDGTKALIDRIRLLKEGVPPDPPIAPCGAPAGDEAASATTEPATQAAEFPEGVYRMEITAEFLTDAGVDRSTAFNHAGTWTLTFKDGKFVGDCPGSTYSVEDGRVTIQLGSEGDCGTATGQVLFSAGWTLDGDQLRFTDVRSGHGSDLLIATLFGGQPFTKID